MPPGEQITFEPAFALMLAEHRIQHATIAREKFVVWQRRGVPLALGHLKKSFEAVGESFVRAEDAKVPLLTVQFRHIAQEWTEHMHIANAARPSRGNVFRIAAVIRHLQVAKQKCPRWRADSRPCDARPWARVRLVPVSIGPTHQRVPAADNSLTSLPTVLDVRDAWSGRKAALDARERCLPLANHQPLSARSNPSVN